MEGEMELNLGGKPRKLKFSMWTIEELERLRTEKAVQPHRLATAYATHLIYAGMANNIRIERKLNDISEKDLDFTWKDVNNWVYQLYDTADGFKQIAEVNKCYQDCNAFKFLTRKEGEEGETEDKKKSNGTISTLLPLENSD